MLAYSLNLCSIFPSCKFTQGKDVCSLLQCLLKNFIADYLVANVLHSIAQISRILYSVRWIVHFVKHEFLTTCGIIV